jgi:hypothetical protein
MLDTQTEELARMIYAHAAGPAIASSTTLPSVAPDNAIRHAEAFRRAVEIWRRQNASPPPRNPYGEQP